MADIKQAAKWMKQGKSVRRSGWPKGEICVYTEHSSTQIMMVSTLETAMVQKVPSIAVLSLRLDSILADDWEIAPTRD